MPKREDEYWAGEKEPKGQGLCPRCGSSNISYNERFESWRCNKCERSFPTPSYGPGEDFGKEARWFGKTTKDELPNYDRYMTPEETTKASERYAEEVKKKASGRAYQKPNEDQGHKWKKRRRGISWTMLLLLIFVIAGIWLINYIVGYSSQLETAVFISLLAASGIVTLWNIRKVVWLWKYRPRRATFGRILSSLLVLALISSSAAAFTGVQPYSDIKDRLAEYFLHVKENVSDFIQDISQPTTSATTSTATQIPKETKTSYTATSQPPRVTSKSPYMVFEGRQPPYSMNSLGIPIKLVNNPNAKDPTWQQLVSFLLLDPTDDKAYNLFSFPCGAFAQEVHNNAETSGISSAWVSINFGDNPNGHALNAFKTMDRGLVFVDCTGDDPRFVLLGPQPDYDKIAYVVIGKEYGLISIGVAVSPDYVFYEIYEQKWAEYETRLEAYNSEVEAYNRALGGRFLLPEPEYSKFKEWFDKLSAMRTELEALSEEIGDSCWESLGIVVSIEIYW